MTGYDLQDKIACLKSQLTLKDYELKAALSANQELIKDKTEMKQKLKDLHLMLSKTELDLADAVALTKTEEEWTSL